MEWFACGCCAVYLVWQWAVARKRNRAGWDEIVSRLKSDGSARGLSASERSGTELHPGMLARGQRALRARGLWVLYANTGVLVELADYAARNGTPEKQATVDALRTEAALLRLNLLACAGSLVLHAAEERIDHHTLRAEQAYAELEVCLTDLVEQQAPDLLPSLVAAS